MSGSRSSYIFALKYPWLNALYDPILRFALQEMRFKARLLEQARPAPGHCILDLACGTATLPIALKQRYPDVTVLGLDGDAKILRLAHRKITRQQCQIGLVRGLSGELPLAPASVDRVISSLFFHHLSRNEKIRTLREVYRILKPGGELHIADFGRARNGWLRLAFFIVQFLDGFATTTDNIKGLMPELIRKAGFQQVEETRRVATIAGSISLIRATRL